MKTGLTGSFARMNQRERVLVLSLIGLCSLLLIGGTAWTVSNHLSDKRAKIKKNAKMWAKIKQQAVPYLRHQSEREALTKRLQNNPDAKSPDSPVAQAAVRTKVHYRTGSTSDEESAMLNKILHPTGDLIQRPLRRKAKNDKGPQIYRVEKQFNMKRGFAKIDDLWGFLGTVESMQNMVFVSKLHLVRWSRDPDYAQIRNLTASTVRYVETEEEE